MRHFADVVLVGATLLVACSPASPATLKPRTLTVFAASSLTNAFTEIGRNFEIAHPGVMVALNFAGSQALRTQIEQGAAADVFASANQKEMDTLSTNNLVAADSSQIFLTNSLVVILPANNPANLHTLEDLSRPGIKLILAAGEVPAGKYARQVLENLNTLYGAGYMDSVMTNVVSNEDNVRQVVTKVQLGEADAGIVYVSDAVAAPDLLTIEIPAEYNVIAQYPVAVLTNTSQKNLAAEFIAYVLSSDGQAVLAGWGFSPISP
jgi:molybdate transport system substrate-binding protein